MELSPTSYSEQRYTVFINLLSVCACILTCYLNCKAFWGDEKEKKTERGKGSDISSMQTKLMWLVHAKIKCDQVLLYKGKSPD